MNKEIRAPGIPITYVSILTHSRVSLSWTIMQAWLAMGPYSWQNGGASRGGIYTLSINPGAKGLLDSEALVGDGRKILSLWKLC
jgi:hypothetical protein